MKAKLAATMVALCSLTAVGQVSAVTLSISCGAVGQEMKLCKQGTQAWAKKTGNTVKVVSTPNSSSERLALYQQLLASHAADIDVFQVDVVWPGILGQYFIDLKPYSDGVEQSHFSALINNNTVAGRLVAMPWFTDAGILYYRKDLLAKYQQDVPTTWQQLTDTAALIQQKERAAGQQRMWGYVWQGRAYEGLTCNALEWINSFKGGHIVEADGRISASNANAVSALRLAASWVGKITPQGALNYTEEEVRGVFQSGNAVFMRNWPYAWALAQGDDSPVKGKVGIVALPKGGPDGQHAAALGGWQLSVSKYSKHPKEAADLVMYLTSYKEQKRRAIDGAYNPTIKALYKDQDVLSANPYLADLYESFANGTPRPSTVTGPKYNQVSNIFYNAVHDVLSGDQQPGAALARVKGQLMRLSRGGKWQ